MELSVVQLHEYIEDPSS